VVAVDEDAREPVVGQDVGLGEVLLAVVDVRQLVGAAVLAPADGSLTVEWLVRAKIIAGEAQYVRRIEALREEMGIAPPASPAGATP